MATGLLGKERHCITTGWVGSQDCLALLNKSGGGGGPEDAANKLEPLAGGRLLGTLGAGRLLETSAKHSRAKWP
eukprot:1468492-Amphidinium_carterae.1